MAVDILNEECQVQIFHDYVETGILEEEKSRLENLHPSDIEVHLSQGFQYNYNTIESNIALKYLLEKKWRSEEENESNDGLIKYTFDTFDPAENLLKFQLDASYKEIMYYGMPPNYYCLAKIYVRGKIRNLNIHRTINSIPCSSITAEIWGPESK